MSWDVLIVRYATPYAAMSEIPADERPLPLGPHALVHDSVCQAFPGTNWADPAWGRWTGPSGSIEFNLGAVDPAQGLMLHVNVDSNAGVVPAIARLCAAQGWLAIDCSGSGEFIGRSGAAGPGPDL